MTRDGFERKNIIAMSHYNGRTCATSHLNLTLPAHYNCHHTGDRKDGVYTIQWKRVLLMIQINGPVTIMNYTNKTNEVLRFPTGLPEAMPILVNLLQQ